MEASKTKIKFEDIKAGDLIESSSVVHGVKHTTLGVAFEKYPSPHLEGDEWRTSQGGVLTIESDEDEIYRIEFSG